MDPNYYDSKYYIWEARAALVRAKREANLALLRYQKEYTDAHPDIHPGTARAHATTHLPNDIKKLLGVE